MPTKFVLVTGGAGHVGSHLIERLVADPSLRVVSLDNYFTGRPENHIPGAEYRTGDTQDIDRLVPETPAIVYHLGEYARIAPSVEDIALVHRLNSVGTFAVADFCRRRGVGKLVYTGSSTKFAVEGDGRHQSPYAFTKATNVDLLVNMGRWYGLPYAICYLSNGFGPREQGDGTYATLIARFEHLYRLGQPLTVVRPGTQRRGFTWVKDLARGIQQVGEVGVGDGYVLGDTRKYTVDDIARAFGTPIEYVDGRPGRNDSDLDVSKAQAELGWAPTVDVCDHIRAFVRTHAFGELAALGRETRPVTRRPARQAT